MLHWKVKKRNTMDNYTTDNTIVTPKRGARGKKSHGLTNQSKHEKLHSFPLHKPLKGILCLDC